jgi:hypothetical protein
VDCGTGGLRHIPFFHMMAVAASETSALFIVVVMMWIVGPEDTCSLWVKACMYKQNHCHLDRGAPLTSITWIQTISSIENYSVRNLLRSSPQNSLQHAALDQLAPRGQYFWAKRKKLRTQWFLMFQYTKQVQRISTKNDKHITHSTVMFTHVNPFGYTAETG